MDNMGLYITYGELLSELTFANSTKVTKSSLTLSNKTVDPGGDIYEFTVGSGDPSPLVGDVVEQAGFVDCIIEILTSPNRIRIERTGAENLLANGPVNLLHSESIPKYRGEQLIKQAMDTVDRDTRQFFNKRTGVFKIEGNNSHILHFPVPIIEIRKLLINSTDLELIEGRDNDFEVFKGRSLPQDDRWNPKIKLNIRSDSIFSGLRSTSQVFLKNTRTEIEGDFGFLDPDGSTPSEIKEATLSLVVDKVEKPPATSTSTASPTGTLKRIKVDLHEQEFFEPSQPKQEQSSQVSSNERYNIIVAKYQGPRVVSGSFKEIDLRNE